MPPKKGEPKGDVSQIPEVEELVELPEEVGTVPEPHFCLVLGHLVGHPLRVEELPKLPVEGEEVPADPGPLAVHDFDPCELILAKAKEIGDPFLKNIIVVDREFLEVTAKADPEEEKTLAWALRQRLDKERSARKRKKWNDARRNAIAALEAAKAAEEAGEAAVAAVEDACKVVEEEKPNRFLVILRDYGTTPEELQEIAAEGFCAEGLVDLLCAVYLVGETVEERDGGRLFTVPEAPPLVDLYYNEIHAAPINTDLANSTVCTFAKSHTLAHPPGEVSPVEHVGNAVLELVGEEAARRQQFGKWLRDAKPVPGPPSLSEKDENSERYSESRLYQRLMGSTDPLHHDVPLFLHCLTEQVNLSQSGDPHTHEDKTAMCSLEEYLGAAAHDFASEGTMPVQAATASMAGLGADKTVADVSMEVEKPPLLPHLDFAHCMHSLAGGGVLDTRDAVVEKSEVVDAVHRALSQLGGPGAQRSGFPKDAVHSAAQRAALRCRIYPFAPSVPTAEVEQLLLLHAFQDLMKGAQPEMPWNLSDRIYRERIPRQYLSQTLKTAFSNEPAMRTAYLPRHDCLLVALYHKSLPGSVMWHAWQGDLRKQPDPAQWHGGLFTTPTFNDWANIIGKDSSGASKVPQASCILQGIDARQLGYLSTVEKLATPPDGSTILVTTLRHGIQTSLPFPSAAYVEAAIAEPAPLNDAGSSSSKADVGEAPATGKRDAFEASVRHTSKFMRIMKDGMSFGFVDDAAWAARCRAEHNMRLAAATAAAAKAAEEEAPASRPTSPPVVNPDEIPLGGPVESSFPGVNFGQFWMSFPDGARCSARMHHEIAPLDEFQDQSRAKPQLGVLFAYSLASGLVIQVFSDGTVRLIFPLAVPGSEDGPAASPVRSKSQTDKRLPSGNESQFKPGCPEDVEVMRTVTPIGTVIRKLLSGRVEVHYTDGSTAIRNPTLAELQIQMDDLRQKLVETGAARLELLERLCKVHSELEDLSTMSVKPDDKQKAAGLPGHWVVTRPDGTVLGRAAASLRSPTPKPRTPSPIADDAGDADPGADPGDGATAVREPTPKPKRPPLDEFLGGVFVDGGSCVEYPIVQGVSVATHVDIQTQHRTTTSSYGVAMYEDPDDLKAVVAHSDGTRVVKLRKEGGHEIVVTKEKMAVIRCDFLAVRGGMELCVYVDCVDGTRIEVVPQILNGSQLRRPVCDPGDSDSLSTHARVILRRSKGPVIVSHGLGQVDIHYSAEDMSDPEYMQPLDDMTPAYVAHCSEGRLMTQSADGMLFEVRGDQTLAVSGGPTPAAPESPRCSMPETAYMTPGMTELPPPVSGPPPRLFVIYGQGDAEELLTESDIGELLRAAHADRETSVVEGELLGPPLEVCRCHTIFQTKTLNSYQVDTQHQQSLMGPSSDSFDTGWSLGSDPTLTLAPVPPAITKFRQFIQYPTITEEKQTCFLGTLKQYRTWEQEELTRNRAVMQIEVKSGGKDKKGDKSKKGGDKDKGKKDAKGDKKKRSSVVDVPVVDQGEVQPEPAFASDLKLNAFEHLIQVLALRADAQLEPTDADLLEAAIADRDAQAARELEQGQGEASPTGEGPPLEASPDMGYEVAGEEVAEEAAAPPQDEVAAPALAEAPAEPETQDRRNEPESAILRLLRPKVADAPTFAYFKSEKGLQFLMDAGELDPERKPRQRGERPNKKSTPPTTAKRSPWNPRLLGEEVDDEAQDDEKEATQESQIANMEERTPHWGADGEQTNFTRGYEGDPYGEAAMQEGAFRGPEGTMNPQSGAFQTQGLPLLPEEHATPLGPHPDKKNNLWDIYGQPRPAKPSQSHAYVALNTDYLEVEGATDRRVRTSSIAHKKNAGKAPSVQSVRKTGTHALGRCNEIAAGEILGELGVANPEEHWKLTSTMQGLGDCNNLVEVTPGKCRFGVLRQGQLYRMAFYLRNLDVDVTRFNVLPPDSKLVSVKHQPGQLAPGMAAKITVELAAKTVGVLQQLVEVKMKAHIVRVPVTAKILDAKEFDALDNESVEKMGRRIGRHRERDSNTGKRPVEVVNDETYARKKLGDDYLPPPPEFDPEF